MSIQLSQHALTRLCQRNFTIDDVHFIINHGNKMHNAGVAFYQMRDDCIPNNLPGNHHHRRLAGSTVVTCHCGHFVITMYKNKEAFRKDRKKSKLVRGKSRLEGCSYCSTRLPLM